MEDLDHGGPGENAVKNVVEDYELETGNVITQLQVT